MFEYVCSLLPGSSKGDHIFQTLLAFKAAEQAGVPALHSSFAGALI
jgi:hypothetical protein